MSWLNKKNDAEDMTNPADAMHDVPTLSEIAQASKAEKSTQTVDAEHDGLPSVNRKKGNNHIITALGFLFVIGAAVALYSVSTGEKKPKTKKEKEVVVSSVLPPLVIPPPPPPIVTVEPTAQRAGSTPTPDGHTPSAIALRQQGAGGYAGGGQGRGAGNTKAPLDWTDRKMGGGLLLTKASGTPVAGGTPGAPNAGNEPVAPLRPFDPPTAPGGSTSELAKQLETTPLKGVVASVLPNRNFLITKGTAIDCALETAIDSSLPGIVTCRVTRDVYSTNDQVLLIDRGTRMVGEYQSGIKQGQVRVFALWTRAETPKGVIISLNSPGTDALGRAGLEGEVDNHFWQRFGAAMLMSSMKDIVGAAVRGLGGSDNSTTNIYGNAASGGEKIIEKILDSTVSIPPTITKNQGDHIQIMVARDLDFSHVYSLKAK